MNDTNRAVNRVLILVIGLALLALGAAAVLIEAWPVGADAWRQGTRSAQQWMQSAVHATAIAGTAADWFSIGVLAVVVLLIVILVRALTRLGGRRARIAIRPPSGQNPVGRVTVTETFMSDMLQQAFDTRDDILFARVSSNDVRQQQVLHVSVSPRQNCSPRSIVDEVDRLVTSLSALTGRDLCTFISLHSGVRTALASDRRRVR